MSSYKLETTANESWKHIVPLITSLNSFKTEQADDQSRRSSFHERLDVGVIIQPPPGPTRPSGRWLTDDSCTGPILVCLGSEHCCSVQSCPPYPKKTVPCNRPEGTDLTWQTCSWRPHFYFPTSYTEPKPVKINHIISKKKMKPRKRSSKGQAFITYDKKPPHHPDK